MRPPILKAVGVTALSVLLLCTNANPIVRDVACAGENCNLLRPIEGRHLEEDYTLHPPILPRTRPNSPGPSAPTRPGPHTPTCAKRSLWSIFWRRASCEDGQTRPSADVIRTNGNQPATQGQRAAPSQDVNFQQRATDLRNEMQQNWQNRPWFFLSGVESKEAGEWQKALNNRIGQQSGSIQDFVNADNPAVPTYLAEYRRYEDEGFGDYFWAANSKAFAQAVTGHVYVVIPGNRAINQPYEDKGSNWWSYEVPELTRNPTVQSIILLRTEESNRLGVSATNDYNFAGLQRTIWRQGDAPLGTPADEHFGVSRPQWPLDI